MRRPRKLARRRTLEPTASGTPSSGSAALTPLIHSGSFAGSNMYAATSLALRSISISAVSSRATPHLHRFLQLLRQPVQHRPPSPLVRPGGGRWQELVSQRQLRSSVPCRRELNGHAARLSPGERGMPGEAEPIRWRDLQVFPAVLDLATVADQDNAKTTADARIGLDAGVADGRHPALKPGGIGPGREDAFRWCGQGPPDLQGTF